MGSPVVHFEINTSNGPELAKFYADLFGWHTETMTDPPYTMVDTHAGEGINGGISTSGEGQFMLFYAGVPDPQATLDQAQKLGAKVMMPVTEIPNIVTFAIFSDPAGNPIGIIRDDGTQEGPGVSAGKNPGLGWFEVLAADPKPLFDFYTKLFGWKINVNTTDQFIYGEVDTGSDKGIPGGIGSSPDGASHVNIYAGVPDLQATLDKAETLGAKTAMPPMEVGAGTSIAMLIDPQGNTFGLFKHVHPH